MRTTAFHRLVMLALGICLLWPVAELNAQTEGPLTVKPRRPRPTRSTKPPPTSDELPVLKRTRSVAAPDSGTPVAVVEEGNEPSPCPAGYIAVPKSLTEEDEAPPRLTRRNSPPPREKPKTGPEPGEIEYECVYSETIVSEDGRVLESRNARDNLDPFLAKVREQVFLFSEGLPDFICDQLTTRLVSKKMPAEWEYKDRISAEVVYFDRKESYRNLRKNGRPLKKNPEDSGAWSTGEFGTLMLDVFHPSTNAAFEPDGYSEMSGIRTKIYKFSVEQPNSHWRVAFEEFELFPAYDGRVWIDPGSLRPLRIEMVAKDVPSDFPMDSIETAVEYGPVKIADKPYLLISSAGNVSCQRGSPYCSKNEIEFRDYRKFSAESTVTATESSVTFEGEAQPIEENKEEKKP